MNTPTSRTAAFRTAALAVLALLLTTAPAWAVGPLFVTCQVEAGMSPENLASLTIEEYNGSVTLKGMVWEGRAAWFDNAEEGEDDDYDGAAPLCGGSPQVPLCFDEDGGTPLAEAKVRIRGVLVTEGTRDDYLGKPGILWLSYAFTADDGTALGTAEGFVSLQEIDWLWGAASFQGQFTLGGQELMFFGTGETNLSSFVYFQEFIDWKAQIEAWKLEALAEIETEYQEWLAEIEETYADCPEDLQEAMDELNEWYADAKEDVEEEYLEALDEVDDQIAGDELGQWMGSTVMTPRKPGFDFEAAKGAPQVEKMFLKAKRGINKARNERLRVLTELRNH